jgi:hypothetical protein
MNTTKTLAAEAARYSRLSSIVLWVVQILLSIVFSTAGFIMAFQPLDVLAGTVNWVPDVSAGLVRFIGICELLAAVALMVPAVTGIWPQLTALAAGGLTFLMTCATIFHIIRGEFFALPMTVVLTAFAGFVEYERWKLTPTELKGSWIDSQTVRQTS